MEPIDRMLTRRRFLAGAAASAAMYPANSFARVRPRVTIGLCTRDVQGAARAGFDYIEPSGAEIAAMSEPDYKRFADAVLASSIRCDSVYSFIRRKDLVVVGDNVPKQALADYVEQGW